MNKSIPFIIFIATCLVSSVGAGAVFGFRMDLAFWVLMAPFSVVMGGLVGVWFNRRHRDWFGGQVEPADLQVEEQPTS